jgi:hypothetical protein
VQILDGTSAILTEVFCGFSQSLQENVGIVPLLDDNHFLSVLCIGDG